MPFEGLPNEDDPHDDCTHWAGHLSKKQKGEIKDDTKEHRQAREGL